MRHDNNFNLLRLLAASQVVYMHSVAHLHLPYRLWLHLTIAQFPGVAAFFVISGFLVSDSFLRSDIRSFFFKRALRIYPALIVNIFTLDMLLWWAGGLTIASWFYYVVGYFPLYAATASSMFAYVESARWIAFHLPGGVAVYTQSSFFTLFPSGVLWTLTVELSFYLVLPIFLMMVRFSRTAAAAAVCIAAIASFAIATDADLAFYNTHDVLNVTVPAFFWIFALGVLARLYWDRISWIFSGHFLKWLTIYAAVALLTSHITGREYLDYKMAPQATEALRVALMAAVVLSAAFSFPELTRHLRIDKNDFSYGLYLWHMLVVSTLIGFGIVGRWWLWPVVYGAGLGIAALSWFLIERPALKFKRSGAAVLPGTKADLLVPGLATRETR